MDRSSKLFAGLYFLSLLLMAFVWKDHLPFHWDGRVYAYPDHFFALRSFHLGQIPLWDPNLACGTPFLANGSSACFYPPYWALAWTGLTAGLLWVALFHGVMAWLGAYFWLRPNGSAGASALGATSIAGAAYLVTSWTNPFIATACWVPWIFWTSQKLRKSLSLTWTFILALFWTLEILSGYPIFTLYLFFVWVFWLSIERPGLRAFGFFAGSLFLAALLSAVQWLPFLDFLSYSWYGKWETYPYFNRTWDLATLWSPTTLGIPGFAYYKGLYANANFNLYFGLVPLALWALSLFFWSGQKGKFWSLTGLFLLIWTLGTNTFLFRWIPQGLLEFLQPSKAVGLFVFCAVTGAVGRWGRSFANHKKWSPWVLCLGLLWVVDIAILPWRLAHPLPDPYTDSALTQKAQTLRDHLNGGRFLSVRPGRDLVWPDYASSFHQPLELFVPNTNRVWDIRSVDHYLYLEPSGSQNLDLYIQKDYGFGFPGNVWDVAGVRLLLLPEGLKAPHYRLLEKWGKQNLYENTQAAADIRFVPRSKIFADRPSALLGLTRPSTDWKTQVALDPATLPAPRNVRVVEPVQGFSRTAPTRVSFSDTFRSSGYLVFNETFAPGWRAWVDGRPSVIDRAYGLFMTIPVENGKHQVDWRYEPTAFRLGLFLSLLAFILVLSMASTLIHRKDL